MFKKIIAALGLGWMGFVSVNASPTALNLTDNAVCRNENRAFSDTAQPKSDSTRSKLFEVNQQSSWLKKFIYRSIADTSAPGVASLRFYPTLAYAPETSFELGVSALLLYQARNDTNNRVSDVSAFGFVTLENQFGIWIDNALYGHQDKWFFLGRTRWQKFPLLYYGLGPRSNPEEPARADGFYLLVRQRALRKIIPNLFFGPEIDFQKFYNANFSLPRSGNLTEPLGSNGSSNLGLGGALVFDNRHNVLNVRKGLFTELALLRYNDRWGSDFNFTAINLDVRSYHPLTAKNVLAWQVLGNFNRGTVPFNQMALLGGESMMRGYYQGRFRDKNLLAAQIEHRWLPLGFSKKLGAAVFASMGTVAPTVRQFEINQLKWTAGGGLRYLLFRKKDIFVRFDVAITAEGPNFYFYTGEAF